MFVRSSRIRHLPAIVAFLFTAACATIVADSDRYADADFSRYRTFAWASDSPLVESRSHRVDISPLNVRRIREAIERELEAKGYAMSASRESADFAVSFTVGARDVIQVQDYPVFYRGRWRWTPPYYWPNVSADMYTEGMLAVDVFDNDLREPVWHGWARKRIVGGDIDDPEAAIDAAVGAIFARFPGVAAAN